MLRVVAVLALAGVVPCGCGKRKGDAASPGPAAEKPAPAGNGGDGKGGQSPHAGPPRGAAPPATASQTPFVAYQSPDGRFTVDFPFRVPGVRSWSQPSPWGTITDTAYEVDHAGWSVLVAVADLSSPQLARVNLEEVAAAGRDAIAQSLGASVTRDDRQDFGGGNVVREVTYTIPRARNGQGPLYFRYVIHGRRLYTLGILVNGLTVPDADRDRFFNSFRILR